MGARWRPDVNRGLLTGLHSRRSPSNTGLRSGFRHPYAPGDGGGPTNGFRSGLHRPYDPIANWRRAYRSAKAREQTLWVEFMGDSTTLGGGGHGAGADTWVNSVPALVRTAMVADGMPIDGPGFVQMITSAADPTLTWGVPQHLTITGTWATVGGVNSIGSSTANDQVTFTTVYDARYVTMTHLRTGLGAYTFSYRIDGGSWVGSGTQSGGSALFRTLTVDCGTIGPHVVEFRVDTGSLVIEGFTASAGLGGLQLHNAGFSGARASSMPADLVQSQGTIAVPALTVIQIGINDWGSQIALATFRSNLQAKVDAAKAYGSDLVMMTMFPSTSVNENPVPQREYAASLRQVAKDSGALFIDTWSRWRCFDRPRQLAYMDDALHPIPAGYMEAAHYLAKALTAPSPDEQIRFSGYESSLGLG